MRAERSGATLVCDAQPHPFTVSGLDVRGRIGRVPAGPPLTFRPRPMPDGLVALEANGFFLCAEADGTMSLTRQEAGDWEAFCPLDGADMDWLIHVMSHSWLSATRDAVVPRQLVHPTRNFAMQIGDIAIRMDDFLAANRGGDSLASFHFHYDVWKVEQLRQYKPLIYLIAFGKDEIFASLAMTLRSLHEFGRYEGDILLFTDRAPDRLVGIVPPELQKQVKLSAAPASDVLDYTSIKFRICDLKEAEAYQPLLYLDVDVICDRPVEPVLRDIHAASRICVPLEYDLLGDHTYYGPYLFASDPTARPRNERGFSSGLIGIPNIAVARRTFPAIVGTMYGLARAGQTRDPSLWYDQPPANYVLHKLDAADYSVLTPRVVTPVDQSQPVSAIPRRGFAHFCGGVGATETKLPAMRAYLDLLHRGA